MNGYVEEMILDDIDLSDSPHSWPRTLSRSARTARHAAALRTGKEAEEAADEGTESTQADADADADAIGECFANELAVCYGRTSYRE